MCSLLTHIKSEFITARAAARCMVEQHSGVIIFVTGSPAVPHSPGTVAIGAAFGALETLTRSLAWEVSPVGVRVVCLRTSAMPDSRSMHENSELFAALTKQPPEAFFPTLAGNNLLRLSPKVADTARGAVLIASDLGAMLTGTVVNASAGAVPD
jgi:NAD(P)-dependent dehydrogenase (short-subunit alcohol dehydrogenase family)